MSECVVVVGDGAMGTLCALLLHANGYRVILWGYQSDYMEEMARRRKNARYMPEVEIPDGINVTGEDSRIAEADLFVSAVPCQFTRRVWQRLAKYVSPDIPLASITKGVENDTLARPSEILTDVLGNRHPVAVLSGPCIAPEVARKLPTAVVVASKTEDLAAHLQQLFTTSWFRVYTNLDVVGVELAGAGKNVIALAAGIIDGIGAGSNCKASLLTRGIVEIARLGMAMGAEQETFAGLAGLGDLVTTCISPVGRNRTAGEMIGRGMTLREVESATASVIEGIATTRSVLALAERYHVEMPITQGVYQVLYEGLRPMDAIAGLMSRQLKAEAVA